MSSVRPQPIAQGNFSQTPFAHILVYLQNRKLHGTLETRQDGHAISIYFRNGSPVRVSSTEPGKRLGEVLADMGKLTAVQVAESLEEVRRTGELHGQALIRMGLVDGATLVAGITEQMISRMIGAFGYANGEYAFYEGVNLISSGPSELINLNSWTLLMAGIRQYAPELNLARFLGSLKDKSFFIADAADLADFRLNTPERMLCRKLLESPQDLVSLQKWNAVEHHVLVGTLYVLLITKTLKVVSPEEVETSISQMSHDTLESLPPNTGPASWPAEIVQLRNEIQQRAAVISSQNYYEMLGVPRTAPTGDIRKAFFKLAKTYHPDKAAKPGLEDLREVLAYIFANLSEAQSTLIELDSREAYDSTLNSGRNQSGPNPVSSGETEEERQVRIAIESDRMFQKALVLMRQQKNEEALALVETAFQNCPREGDYMATRAQLRLLLGKEAIGDALGIFREALVQSPKSERCHLFFAYALKKDSRINEAKQLFQKVVEMNPRNIEAAREIRLIEMRARQTGQNKKPGFFGKLLK